MARRLGCAMGATLVGLAICCWAPRSNAGPLRGSWPLKAVPAAAGRLIVKYRPKVNACVHCLVAKGIPFATVTGTDSLDRLNRQLGVRGARALAFDQRGFKGTRSAAYLSKLAAIRARFPERTARAAAPSAPPDLSNLYVLDLPRDTDVELAAALYSADPDVEYAQPDYELKVSLTPDDPFYSSSGTWQQPYDDLWGLHIANAGTAWDTATGTGEVVAVVDTGVDYNHPDMAANMWTNPNEIPGNGIDDDGNGFVDDVYGWNFVGENNDPMDDFGHGTHVAGTVAAAGNNGIGVVGMAYGARVMAVKGLNQRGIGYTSDLAAAVLYAAENGADVLNASFGGFSFNLATGLNSALRDAVETASALGVVVVASAGNAATNVNYQEPAGYPTVIAVGASDYLDQRASFSNFGSQLSVVAPGVDVLSLRSSTSAPIDPYGEVVASRYIRLNGTSMASPHVAGLSALLLSAQPSLTPDEVRWHLELNADQPGYPGYEGLLFNPYLGYGRIDAARVFDTPPVTTRLKGQADLHAYVDSIDPDVASARFLFTTLDPVAWTLSSPSWLAPSATSGSGLSQLSFSTDTTGLGVGQYTGDVVLDAPGAVDGGGSFPVTMQTHSDPRIDGAVEITADYVDSTVPPGGVRVVGDGAGVFTAWEQRYSTSPPQVYAARMDGAGNLHGPYLVHTSPHLGAYHEIPRVAFDGRNYLVLWDNDENVSSYPRDRYRSTVMAVRVTPSGEVLDPTPIELGVYEDGGGGGLYDIEAAWDGEAYTVIWEVLSSRGRGKVYARRLGADGTLRGKARKLFPNRATRLSRQVRWIRFKLACVTGGCLFVWGDRSGTTTSAGYFLDGVYGVRLDGAALLDGTATLLLSGINLGFGDPQITTNGSEYLVIGEEAAECSEAICGVNLLAARVSSVGLPIGSGPSRLNAISALSNVGGLSVGSDGENYLVSFIGGGSRFGHQIFGFRVGPDLQPIDTESPGALLLPDNLGTVPPAFGGPLVAKIVGSPTHAISIWADTLNFDPNSPTVSWTNPISAQRVFSRALPAGFPTQTIGAIGPLSGREREMIRFALVAPGLDPATTTFSASGLPSGAVLDPTGLFHWVPAGTEAGTYPGVHFEASDAAQTVSEEVTIAVAEASHSLSGTVTVSGGGPATGVELKIVGHGVRGWTVATDAGGNFRVEDLAPGRYTLRLDRAARKQYVASPTATHVTVGSADVNGISIVVSPR